MPMDRGTPDLVRHCVAAVAKQYGGDTSKAFAICVAQLQKNGYLKPGTMELTAAGKKKEKEHEAEPDAEKKLKSYEKLLKAAREESVDPSSDFRSFFDRLKNPRTSSGFEGIPTTVARRYENVSKDESPMAAMRRLAGVSSVYEAQTAKVSHKDLVALVDKLERALANVGADSADGFSDEKDAVYVVEGYFKPPEYSVDEFGWVDDDGRIADDYAYMLKKFDSSVSALGRKIKDRYYEVKEYSSKNYGETTLYQTQSGVFIVVGTLDYTHTDFDKGIGVHIIVTADKAEAETYYKKEYPFI